MPAAEGAAAPPDGAAAAAAAAAGAPSLSAGSLPAPGYLGSLPAPPPLVSLQCKHRNGIHPLVNAHTKHVLSPSAASANPMPACVPKRANGSPLNVPTLGDGGAAAGLAGRLLRRAAAAALDQLRAHGRGHSLLPAGAGACAGACSAVNEGGNAAQWAGAWRLMQRVTQPPLQQAVTQAACATRRSPCLALWRRAHRLCAAPRPCQPARPGGARLHCIRNIDQQRPGVIQTTWTYNASHLVQRHVQWRSARMAGRHRVPVSSLPASGDLCAVGVHSDAQHWS